MHVSIPTSSSSCRWELYLRTLFAVSVPPCDLYERTANKHVCFSHHFRPALVIDGVCCRALQRMVGEKHFDPLCNCNESVCPAANGAAGERKRRNSNNDISIRYWSHLSALVRVQSGKKRVVLNWIRWYFVFFYIQSQNWNCSRLQPPHRFAERLGMGPRSDSCWAFVIKHARAFYRLMTSLITGNYRRSRLVGVPSRPRHPVFNVSNSTTAMVVAALLNPFVPTLGGCGHSRALTKQVTILELIGSMHHELAFSYGLAVTT